MSVFGWLPGSGRLLPVALVGVVIAGLLGATVASANDAPAECAVSAPSLGEARDLYADDCSLPRVDCDEIGGLWYCSSRVIGKAAPGGVTADDVGASGIGNDGTVVVTVPTTAAPPTEPPTTEPPTTEPPVTEPPVTEPPDTPAPTTTVVAPTTTAAPNPEPPTGQCGVVAIEAESLTLNGAWSVVQDGKASGGEYITWEGLSKSGNNSSPADVISTSITIDKPGSYRFTWAMRQPSDVDSDKANDSWLNFADAARFGPTSGGTYPGFIKVYGNATGNFSYSGTADVNHNKSAIAIDFDQAGTYTMQIAGRSHGHQIDRIVLFHESISKSDAIAGNGADCDGGPTPTPTPTTPDPTPTTAPTPTTVPAPNPGNCQANTSGKVDLSRDLISLQYDHAPDRDDAHASAAGKEVSTKIGFTPWVVGGAYGADNKGSYQDETEPVMDAIWGSANWVNADADWNGAVSRTADRWQQTLEACGDIWIAEGGQSDFSADVVRALKNRMANLNTTSRIHLVQHSNWNEEKALDADLAYVKANTDYIRISDGNGGGNGTAGFNDQNYDGPFVDAALNGPNAAGWRAAFDYYPPRSQRLDFSDTVELMEILDIDTDQVSDIQDFVDVFMS